MGRALSMLAVMLLTFSTGHAQTFLVDDFSDGDDEGWTHLVTGEDIVYDASQKHYHLRSTDVVRPGGGGLISVWDASADDSYSNGILRATVRAGTLGSGGHLLVRVDARQLNGYGFLASTDNGNDSFQIRSFLGGSPTVLASLSQDELAFRPGDEWNIEAAATRDQLSLKAWRVGDPVPAEPQLVATDSNYSTGLLGVTAGIAGDASEPAMTDFKVDDIYFTIVPEPASSLTFVFGLVAITSAARKSFMPRISSELNSQL